MPSAQQETGTNVAGGIPEPIEPISYRELAERYLAQYDARSKRWFMDMLRPSLARFGSTSLLSLRPDEIAVWLAGLPHAASTNEKRLDVMRQVLKMGVEWGYLSRNPARPEAVKGPTAIPTDVRPFRSWDEVFAVASLLGPHRPAAIFATSTGTRPEEWIALEPTDVSKDAGTCLIEKTFTKGTLSRLAKNDHGRRTILLPALAMEAIEEAESRRALALPGGDGRLPEPLQLAQTRLVSGPGQGRPRAPPALPTAPHVRDPQPRGRCEHRWISRYMGHSDIQRHCGTTLASFRKPRRATSPCWTNSRRDRRTSVSPACHRRWLQPRPTRANGLTKRWS